MAFSSSLMGGVLPLRDSATALWWRDLGGGRRCCRSRSRVADPTLEPTAAAPLRERLIVIAAVVVAVLAWASAFVVIRAVAPAFDPGALTLGRLGVAVLVLG